MKKVALGAKMKGLLEVLASNFLVLIITTFISFILPLCISVEEYGKWQLFSLIIGYAGFFALGFNDGIHVNYSGIDYNNAYFFKFRAFRRFIDEISISSTVLTLIVIIFNEGILKESYVVYILSALNIIPVLVNGFFAYVNQGTMRFNYYAKANTLEKIFYVVMMAILILLGVKEAVYYMLTYTVARYFVIIYNRLTSKEIYGKPSARLGKLKPEIKQNFISGFVLMIATLCNQSIIVPGRLLAESQYGLVTFSCYSFAIHTMVIANQISTALSQVFYPAMKRTKPENFMELFKTIDDAVGLLSVILLFSYYPVYILVKQIYVSYTPILEYLYCLYPMFMFASKSMILIINTYKMDLDNKQLLINNALGVMINLLSVLTANYIFRSIYAIALFSLFGYVVWYYFCYIRLLKQRKRKLKLSNYVDLIIVFVFVISNALLKSLDLCERNYIAVSTGAYVMTAIIAFFIFRKYCIKTAKNFITYMNS